jgi:hypothetical protein
MFFLCTSDNLLIKTPLRRCSRPPLLGAIGFYDRPQPGVSGAAKLFGAFSNPARRVRKGNGSCRLVLSPSLDLSLAVVIDHVFCLALKHPPPPFELSGAQFEPQTARVSLLES